MKTPTKLADNIDSEYGGMTVPEIRATFGPKPEGLSGGDFGHKMRTIAKTVAHERRRIRIANGFERAELGP